MVMLALGEHRLGWLYDQDESTHQIAVVVERTPAGVIVRIPLGQHVDEVYQRWFGEGIGYGDDPDRSRFSYRPPDLLWVDSQGGTLALVGTYARSWSQNLLGGAGEGVVGCSLAVAGSAIGVGFEKVNRFETTVPGLDLWLGRSALERTITRGEDTRPDRLDVQWQRESWAPLGRRLNLRTRPTFEFTDRVEGDRSVLESSFVLETRTVAARPWRDHLEAHLAVPALMTIAAWHSWGVEDVRLLREDDPLRTADGSDRGWIWRSGVVSGIAPVEAPAGKPHFLFRSADLPGMTLARWFGLYDEFSEPLRRLVRMARWERTGLVGQVQELGSIVELLAQALAVEQAMSNSERKNLSYQALANLIWEDLPDEVRSALDGWPKVFRDGYTAVKHANRETPPDPELARLTRGTRLVLRLWVGRRLGVSGRRLDRAARIDPDGRLWGI